MSPIAPTFTRSVFLKRRPDSSGIQSLDQNELALIPTQHTDLTQYKLSVKVCTGTYELRYFVGLLPSFIDT